jgi:hypothetical protein
VRLILGLVLLFATFALLVRLLPAPWALPLYIFFVIVSAVFVAWERRQIAARRRSLEQALQREHPDLSRVSRYGEEE